jgi:DHA1 family inner membrane transport protein
MPEPAVRARPTAGRGQRSVTGYAAALLAFEATIYAVLSPMLPHYEHVFGASKAALGVLAGATSYGLVVGSVLGMWLAASAGVRRTTVAGLVGFAVAVGFFGFASSITVLIVLRAVQGMGAGLIWGGALTWAVAAAAADRRGTVVGSAFGAAWAASLVGPLIGTLAVSVGGEVVFAVLGVIALGLAAGTYAYPEPELPPWTGFASLARLRRNPAVLLAMWILTLESVAGSVFTTLVPLRLARFGASAAGIGATFLVMGALSAVVSLLAGRIADRYGRPVLAGGLALAGALALVVPIPANALVLAVITVCTIAGPMAVFLVPATSMLMREVERIGVSLPVATMLMNLAFAGPAVGAPGGAALAQVTSDAVPFAIAAALLVATAALVLLWRRHATAAAAMAEAGQVPGPPPDGA